MNSPISEVLDALHHVTGFKPVPTDSGWKARCPVHDDSNPSLSVSETDDGNTLLHCYAGCDFKAIRDALGLQNNNVNSGMSTLSTSTKPQKTRGKEGFRRQGGGKSTFPTANDAVEALKKSLGNVSRYWTYHDGNGEPCGVILRWDSANGKDIRPVSRNCKGWIIGAMAEPRPLYQLPTLRDAKRVYITEGEKAADALRSLGIVATTSPHGSESPKKTDWQPLAGKECVILPDNDEPGQKYASKVADLLGEVRPLPRIKIVDLPDLPTKGDAFDFVELRRSTGQTDGDIAMEIEMIVVDSPSETVRPPIDPYQPFPTYTLPEPLRSFVSNGAKAIGCDPSYLALPLLSMTAAVVGSTRRIQLKRGWTARPFFGLPLLAKAEPARLRRSKR